jgi:CBS-domain-containing membrane protein
MTCREIMNLDPLVAFAENRIGDALEMLLEHRYLALPVLDRNRRYLGLPARSRRVGSTISADLN